MTFYIDWYKNCCLKFLPEWSFTQRRGYGDIKKQLQNSEFDCFVASDGSSDGWLDKWKATYAIKEPHILGEARYVSAETVTSWVERLQELTEGYSLENIWNMDESGYFFKALPETDLVQKWKQTKGGKKEKHYFTIPFFC